MTSKSSVLVVSLLPILTGVALAACSDSNDNTGSGAQGAGTTGTNGVGTTAPGTETSASTATTGSGTTNSTTSPAVTTGTSAGTETSNATSTTTTAGDTTTGTAMTGVGGATSTDTASNTGGASSTGPTTTGGGGTGGGVTLAEGPCDIYAAADVPCVAAYSTVRILNSEYTGPLYQIRKGGPNPNTGSGGETLDIEVLPNGFADGASHEAFCGSESCTFSKLYDQSGRGNDLTVAKKGCYNCDTNPPDSACTDDYESNAMRRPTVVGGNNVFALYMDTHEGYRTGGVGYPETAAPGNGMPTGNEPQGIYSVAEGLGKRSPVIQGCCWNFGNASTNNCYGPSGQMNALFFGKAWWGEGTGDGPWFLGDFEAGVWAGGQGAADAHNPNSPAMTMDYAFGILKTNASNYAIRMGDATSGELTTAYDGGLPSAFQGGTWSMQGSVVLGIGGDNSNHGAGTFLEGAITAGRPSDETDAAVHANVKAAGYGQ